MSVGGLILGPFVQKYAFGAFWTGVPWGWDFTDNKMLLMWLAWAGACTVLWRTRTRTPTPRSARAAVIAGALVMTVVYLVPHSFKGSQLDYSRLERGVPAAKAVETGH
jgi:peptidoglycan/LPS O-acetylase OafA/YrhL